MCLPRLGSSVPAHRAQGPCWSVWHWWALPSVSQVPWAAPVSCRLCPLEAMTPLCGSLSETWDSSSTRNSANLQSLSGSPFPFREVLKLSASCREQRTASVPGWLWVGRSAWVEIRTVIDWAAGGPCCHCQDVSGEPQVTLESWG